VICEFLYFIEDDVTERVVYRTFLLGRNFVSGLICSLKSKKNIKKTLKLYPKNLRFSSSAFKLWYKTQTSDCTCMLQSSVQVDPINYFTNWFWSHWCRNCSQINFHSFVACSTRPNWPHNPLIAKYNCLVKLVCSGVFGISEGGGAFFYYLPLISSLPLPSPLCHPSSLTLLSPPLPSVLPSLPVRSRTPEMQLGGLGRNPNWNRIWYILALKSW